MMRTLALWICAAVMITCAFEGCGPRRVPARQRRQTMLQRRNRKPVKSTPARARAEDVKVSISDPAGKRMWEGSADAIEYDDSRRKASLDGAQTSLLEDGKPVLRAKAGKAVPDLKTRVVEFSGNVEVTAVEGEPRAFSSERARWEAASGKVEAWGRVKFVRGESVVEGEHLIGDSRLKRVRVEGAGGPVRIVVVQGGKK